MGPADSRREGSDLPPLSPLPRCHLTAESDTGAVASCLLQSTVWAPASNHPTARHLSPFVAPRAPGGASPPPGGCGEEGMAGCHMATSRLGVWGSACGGASLFAVPGYQLSLPDWIPTRYVSPFAAAEWAVVSCCQLLRPPAGALPFLNYIAPLLLVDHIHFLNGATVFFYTTIFEPPGRTFSVLPFHCPVEPFSLSPSLKTQGSGPAPHIARG